MARKERDNQIRQKIREADEEKLEFQRRELERYKLEKEASDRAKKTAPEVPQKEKKPAPTAAEKPRRPVPEEKKKPTSEIVFEQDYVELLGM